MKKTPILISISAALLLCAVLCTAGCVEAPSDPIVGDWVSETGGSVTYAVFENGGTGYFAADEDSVLTLEWKANGDKTYTFLFADGRAVTASLDAEHGLMTIGNTVYEKQPSALSGTAMTEEQIEQKKQQMKQEMEQKMEQQRQQIKQEMEQKMEQQRQQIKQEMEQQMKQECLGVDSQSAEVNTVDNGLATAYE